MVVAYPTIKGENVAVPDCVDGAFRHPSVPVTHSLHPTLPSPSLSQIIEWFEEYAEEFFQTHTELGESLEIATTLVMEVQQFETSTQVQRAPH